MIPGLSFRLQRANIFSEIRFRESGIAALVNNHTGIHPVGTSHINRLL
jgi:hypothetical protein